MIRNKLEKIGADIQLVFGSRLCDHVFSTGHCYSKDHHTTLLLHGRWSLRQRGRAAAINSLLCSWIVMRPLADVHVDAAAAARLLMLGKLMSRHASVDCGQSFRGNEIRRNYVTVCFRKQDSAIRYYVKCGCRWRLLCYQLFSGLCTAAVTSAVTMYYRVV